MCEPVTLGTVGSAAMAGTVVSTGATIAAFAPAIAPTTGLFGVGGTFSAMQTFSTLSTMSSLFGGLYSGAAASANAKYQANMHEYQAKVDENNAIMEERAAEYDADIIDARKQRYLSSKQANSGKNGTVIADGSNLATTINSYEEFTAERLARLYQGDVAASALRTGAKTQGFAAKNARKNAKRSEYGSYINAATTITKGAYKGGLLA